MNACVDKKLLLKLAEICFPEKKVMTILQLFRKTFANP